jgi:phosphoenolpyruvate synthase/pyruvate phosphate dikinase
MRLKILNTEGRNQTSDMIRSFNELTAEQQPYAGGKGRTLAQLYQAGYLVPDGFVILPTAFTGDKLKKEAWVQIQTQITPLRKRDKDLTFAVRSSALSEDSAQASFAGEFETILNVHSNEIQTAINTVRQSRHSERVQAYSEVQGLEELHDMAVIVQRMVQAEVSGARAPIYGKRFVRSLGTFSGLSGPGLYEQAN